MMLIGFELEDSDMDMMQEDYGLCQSCLIVLTNYWWISEE
jgi:hypothetical protein